MGVVVWSLIIIGLLLGTLVSMDTIGPRSLVIEWEALCVRYELWRIFTACFFMGPLNLTLLVHIATLVSIGMQCESQAYNTGSGGSSADFLWMLILGCLGFPIFAIGFNLQSLSGGLITMILYVWSRKYENIHLERFKIKFPALSVPWIYSILAFAVGCPLTVTLPGILIGHVYYYCVDVFPNANGYELVTTPSLLVKLMESINAVTKKINKE
jgi:Derlin-2/3